MKPSPNFERSKRLSAVVGDSQLDNLEKAIRLTGMTETELIRRLLANMNFGKKITTSL